MVGAAARLAGRVAPSMKLEFHITVPARTNPLPSLLMYQNFDFVREFELPFVPFAGLVIALDHEKEMPFDQLKCGDIVYDLAHDKFVTCMSEKEFDFNWNLGDGSGRIGEDIWTVLASHGWEARSLSQ